MQSTQTPETGAVSAQAEKPKDVNQNTFTQEEKDLAARHKVEPKLVRLLKEIAEEHFAEPEEVETQEQPQEEENHPNTGIPILDDCIERISLDGKVAAYCIMRLMCIANDTGNKISDYLRKEMVIFEDLKNVEKQTAMDSQIWSECTWFLGFVRGAEIGYREA